MREAVDEAGVDDQRVRRDAFGVERDGDVRPDGQDEPVAHDDGSAVEDAARGLHHAGVL